jgi:hypothetical protein
MEVLAFYLYFQDKIIKGSFSLQGHLSKDFCEEALDKMR